MKKYAQIYQGKIIYFEETDDLKTLLEKYSPSTIWQDVTGIECGLGWDAKFDKDSKLVLTPPPAPVPPTLEEMKAIKKNELKAERDMLAEQPIVLDDMAFDFDEKARTNIDVAIKGSAPSEKVDWTLADNKTVKISVDDLKKLYPMAKKRGNDLHISYRIASEKINACRTIDEVCKVTLLPQGEAATIGNYPMK